MYRGFKPFSRSYFAVASTNASEQFMQFVQLVSWLLELNNQKVTGWNKYDDPTTASQNMLLELKKLNIELDMPASKLKAGHGDGVCALLIKLCTVSLTAKFKFRKAVIKDEAGGRDAEEDGDDGAKCASKR